MQGYGGPTKRSRFATSGKGKCVLGEWTLFESTISLCIDLLVRPFFTPHLQATVAGLKFSARTTLEVREWPEGLPDFAHFYDEMWEGRSRQDRASDYAKVPLRRYSFPRPFAISKLPTRDITMQSVEDDDGEFRMYQGVWRLQPLPGCTPKDVRGLSAMRLTYAVEGRLH